MNPLDQLRALFQDGARQLGFRHFERPEGPPVVVQKKAATAGDFSLRSLQVAGSREAASAGISVSEQRAGELIPLSAAITERSRVGQAGARFLVVDPAKEARPAGEGTGVLAFQYQRTQFITVEPAPFATMPEPNPEVPESDVPVSRIFVGFNGSTNDSFGGPSYAVRFNLTRRHVKDISQDQLLGELLLSITLGLARAADHALLSAIAGTTPAAFNLAAAAAAGVAFSELRALVGTSGAGAAVGQDGRLRAAGIAAELTPTIAPTVVGSFARAGVAVHDSLRIALERTNARGDLIVTCWADLQPLLPDESFFWTL